MNNKIIITICREFGSEGHEIGKELSRQLQIPLYDKDLLAMSAKESGIDLDTLASIDEKLTRRFLSSYMNTSSDLLNDRLFEIESNKIKQLAQKESCIIIGRLADYVLRERTDCLKILITADFEKRVTIIAKKHDITYTEAKKLVGKMDTARAAYYKYYSNGKWSHEKGKDIILNRATLGIEGCVEIIKDYVVWKEDCLEKVIL